MKIIIAPNSVHTTIHNNLLKDGNTVFNVSVLTLNTFKARFLNLGSDNVELKCQALHLIAQMKHTLTLLSDAFDFIDHQISLFNFALECHQLGIPYSTLPQETVKEQDIYRVCIALQPLFSRFDSISLSVSKVAHYDIYIYPCPVSAIDLTLIQALFNANAKTYTLSSFSSKVQIRSALNPSLEAHAIAQFLAQNSELKTSILCADRAQLPLLHHALKLYNVHYSTTISHFVPIVSAIISALKYVREPNLEHLLAYCRQNHLYHHFKPAFLKYIEFFNIPFEALSLPFNHLANANLDSSLFEREISTWRQLESEAEAARSTIMDVVHAWTTDSPLDSIYTFFIYHQSNSYEDTLVLSDIKSLFETVINSPLPLHTQIEFIIYQLNTKTCLTKQDDHFVTIHNLHNVFVPLCDQVIIMGATANHYPPTHKYSGLIDESYLAKIDTYPTLSQRNQALVSFEKHLFNQAPCTILSYPEATLDGKPLECSISLKNVISDPIEKAWNVLRQSTTKTTKDSQLAPSISRNLFIKNNSISSSVSAIEQFFNCSYQYFFDKGLKIVPLKTIRLSAAHVGTMMHYIIECWINAGTPHLTEAFINTSLNNFKNDIHQCFPYHTAIHNITLSLLTKKMMVLYLRLAYLEKDTLFSPHKSEFRFEHSIAINSVNLNLRGSIDRVDHYEDAFRIIDYKSSAKRIVINKVLSGRQIQLFTYQMMYAAITQKTPTGVHYYSLKNEVISTPPKYKQKLGSEKKTYLEINTYDPLEYFLQKTKINSSYINAESAKYYLDELNRFGFKKDRNIQKRYHFIENKISEALQTIFASFVTHLNLGNIVKDPAEVLVCKYCDFYSICNFNGPFLKKDPLVNITITHDKSTLLHTEEE